MKISWQTIISGLIAGGFLCAVAATPASAQYHHDHGYGHGYGGWHGDIHHFGEYDYARWRGGRWYNGFHGGRVGWYWVIGDQYYYYPQPVYPYPSPYVPPGMPVAGPPGQFVYYCPGAGGYYPYVPQCYQPWQAVPQGQPIAPPPAAYAPSPPAAPAYAALSPAGRDADDRQLNNFAVELSSIHTKSPQAAAHLDDLHARIEAFRQALYSRPYNAMDILHDTERLEKRVAAKRAKVFG